MERIAYIPALDGLRAVGVILVLITHASKPGYLPGGYGVDIFFVLSGFLITSLLIVEWNRTSRVAFGAFYIRRFIRLYPALVAYLAVSLVLGLLVLPDTEKFLTETIGALFYLTPFTEYFLGVSAFYGHLWTLAYEEYFYLVWPLVFVILMKLKLPWRAQAAIMIGGGTLLYLAFIGSYFILDHPLAMLRTGGLAIGCGVGIVITHTTKRGNGRLLALAGVACLVAAWLVSSRGNFHSFNAPLAAFGTVALLYSILGNRRTIAQRILETKPFVFVGRISYELYLWHPTILIGLALAVGSVQNQVWWWAYPIVFALAIGTHFGFAPLQKSMRRKLATRTAARSSESVAA